MPDWKGIVGKSFTSQAFVTYVAGLSFTAWRPQFVVVHNTGDPTLTKWKTLPGARWMKGLERYYRDEQKWSAGPHLFVADDLIWVFTPLDTPGVHAPSWNGVSWGVEIVGDYDHEPFSDASRTNALSALTTLHAALGLDPGMLRFHKEDPKTTHKHCPGVNVKKAALVKELRSRLVLESAGEHATTRKITPA